MKTNSQSAPPHPSPDLSSALQALTGVELDIHTLTSIGPGIAYLLRYPTLEVAHFAPNEEAFPDTFFRLLETCNSWKELLPQPEKASYLKGVDPEAFLRESRYGVLVNRRGETVPVVDHRELIRNESGQPVAIVGRLVDDSFRSMALDSLVRRSWKEIATSMTRRFLHDFNNTIAGIYSLSELFAEPGCDPKSTVEAMRHIRDSSIRAQELTKRIRHLTTLETGQPGYHGIRSLIEDQVEYMSALLPKGAAINLKLDPGEFPCHIDPNLFRQVLLHFTSNAYDACGDGIELEIRLHASAESDLRLCVVEFRDNGRGFTDEELEKGREPFFTTKDKEKHPGLGLSIAESLAQKTGGRLELTNSETGALIRLFLPLIAQQSVHHSDPLQADPPKTAAKLNAAERANPSSDPLELLVYTWEDLSRHPLVALMEKAGWKLKVRLDSSQILLDLAAKDAKPDGVIVFKSALDDRAEPLISELGRAKNCRKVALLSLEGQSDSLSNAAKRICGFVASSSSKPSVLLAKLDVYFR